MAEKLHQVRVNLAERSYNIDIGRGLLNEAASMMEPLLQSTSVFIAMDENVATPHGDLLTRALVDHGLRVETMSLPAGEPTKSVKQLNAIWEQLCGHRYGRDCAVVALGGGVIGDLVGFAAASYLRGVDFFQVPTSLLAMVDSSVGGKTGINNKFGKNLLGAFWQPKHVLIDVDTLQTLPREERISALAEIIKYGVIYDADLFAWLEEEIEAVRDLEPSAVARAVQRSCEIKAAVVSEDERESGLREILNFGHTVGHAIENAAGYGGLRHGEAIAIGMVGESRMALNRATGWSQEDHLRLYALIEKAGLPTAVPDSHALGSGPVMAAAMSDKKNRAGTIRCVLPLTIGAVKTEKVTPQEIESVLEELGVD